MQVVVVRSGLSSKSLICNAASGTRISADVEDFSIYRSLWWVKHLSFRHLGKVNLSEFLVPHSI